MFRVAMKHFNNLIQHEIVMASRHAFIRIQNIKIDCKFWQKFTRKCHIVSYLMQLPHNLTLKHMRVKYCPAVHTNYVTG